MSGRTVEGQRPEVDTYRTQISCPNCEEKARGLHHNPTPPNQTLHPSQWAVLKRDPPLGVTALLFTKLWYSWGDDKNYSFNKRKNKRNTGSGTKEADDSLGVGPAKHAGSLSTQKKTSWLPMQRREAEVEG